MVYVRYFLEHFRAMLIPGMLEGSSEEIDGHEGHGF